MARKAHALATLYRQVHERYPLRDTGSDGWIGDSAHASRPSDHNPNDAGVVRAQDFDENDTPSTDRVGKWLWGALLASRDPRIKYVIYEGQMFSSYPVAGYPAWTPRPYSGSNKHLAHLHVSVDDAPSRYDDPREWNLGEEEAMSSLSDEDIRRIWAYKIGVGEDQAKPAWARLHDADVRTREIKEAVAKLTTAAAVRAADIAVAVVDRFVAKLARTD